MEQLSPSTALALTAAVLLLGTLIVIYNFSPKDAPLEHARSHFGDDLVYGLVAELDLTQMHCAWEAERPEHSETRMVVCSYERRGQATIRAEYHFNQNEDFVYANLISPNSTEAN